MMRHRWWGRCRRRAPCASACRQCTGGALQVRGTRPEPSDGANATCFCCCCCYIPAARLPCQPHADDPMQLLTVCHSPARSEAAPLPAYMSATHPAHSLGTALHAGTPMGSHRNELVDIHALLHTLQHQPFGGRPPRCAPRLHAHRCRAGRPGLGDMLVCSLGTLEALAVVGMALSNTRRPGPAENMR